MIYDEYPTISSTKYVDDAYQEQRFDQIMYLLIISVAIFCFCCGIYQVMNYQNEKAKFKRICHYQVLKYNQQKQQEQEIQQSNGNVQSYIG
jgi:hypothetical protein